MRLHTETAFGVGTLLALQLLTAFGAIGLLARVSPAAEQILRENVYSTEAVEEMLATLASPAPAADRFEAALARAEGNVTEDAELPLLAAVRDQMRPALEADPAARLAVISALQELSVVNRTSMQIADENAQRIGVSGAWAATFLGSISFFLGVLVYRRLRARLEAPLLEIDAVLYAARSGDSLRRCPPLAGPDELGRVIQNLNWILDHANTPTVSDSPAPAAVPAERRILLTLLDQLPRPALLHHPAQGTLAASQSALDLPHLDPEAPDWQAVPVPGTPLRLLLWAPDQPDAEE